MKKVLSLIALVGIFAACQQEKVQTAFTVNPAEATITLHAVCLQSGEDVTASTVFTTSAGTVNGNVVTMLGNKALAETVANFGASYNHSTYGTLTASITKTINKILGGGKGVYDFTIYVGSPLSDYKLRCVAGTPRVNSETASLVNSHFPFEHDGHSIWMSNDSEFCLSDSATYPTYAGSAVQNIVVFGDFDNEVQAYAAAYNKGIEEGEDVIEYTVSAFALYNVFATRTTTVTPYTVYAQLGSAPELTAGTFEVVEMSSTAEWMECALPGHESHYHAGHGHGHADGANAGGGIIFAE